MCSMSLFAILKLKAKEYNSVKKSLTSWLEGKEESNGKMMKLSDEQQTEILVRWLIKTKEKGEIRLRFKEQQKVYEVTVHNHTHIKVNRPYEVSRDESYVMYEWQVNDCKENMTKEKVEAARKQANRINEEKQETIDTLFSPKGELTAELCEMMEEFLQGQEPQINYLCDLIHLTDQDRQEAMEILNEL